MRMMNMDRKYIITMKKEIPSKMGLIIDMYFFDLYRNVGSSWYRLIIYLTRKFFHAILFVDDKVFHEMRVHFV